MFQGFVDNDDARDDNLEDYYYDYDDEDHSDYKHDDCDDDGTENIDFVQAILFQGLPITGNFLAENLTFPQTEPHSTVQSVSAQTVLRSKKKLPEKISSCSPTNENWLILFEHTCLSVRTMYYNCTIHYNFTIYYNLLHEHESLQCNAMQLMLALQVPLNECKMAVQLKK